jgi:hypothetical protein
MMYAAKDDGSVRLCLVPVPMMIESENKKKETKVRLHLVGRGILAGAIANRFAGGDDVSAVEGEN